MSEDVWEVTPERKLTPVASRYLWEHPGTLTWTDPSNMQQLRRGRQERM